MSIRSRIVMLKNRAIGVLVIPTKGHFSSWRRDITWASNHCLEVTSESNTSEHASRRLGQKAHPIWNSAALAPNIYSRRRRWWSPYGTWTYLCTSFTSLSCLPFSRQLQNISRSSPSVCQHIASTQDPVLQLLSFSRSVHGFSVYHSVTHLLLQVNQLKYSPSKCTP